MEKQEKTLDSARDKKIILAITKSNFGGAQKYVYTLAKNLKMRGFEVKVMLGGKGALTEKLKEQGIDIIEIKSLKRDLSWKKDLEAFKEIREILKKEKPDVFHINSSKIGAVGSLAGKLARIDKVIFTAHGFAFNEKRSPISKLILKIIYWFIFAISNKTIFVSKETMRQAPKIFLPNKKFKVIYNGIEKINFYEREKARNLLQISREREIIGTLAELHPIKRIDKLIEVSSEIDCDFVILGEGEDRKRLEKKIKEKGVENKFHLKGYVDEADRYIKAFDLFVLVSDSEAMPLSIIEAMQANVPIIATDVGGIKEMIPKKYLIKKDLKEKINKFIKTKPEYDLNKFSLEEMIQKTVELYN